MENDVDYLGFESQINQSQWTSNLNEIHKQLTSQMRLYDDWNISLKMAG